MIIVTGANGFIGSAMVWELNQAGITDIIAVDTIPLTQHNLLINRKYSKFILKNDLWSFLDSAESKKVSWIIHMGACSATTETNWNFLLENNVQYTERIWIWCSTNKVPLIYASSAATYGDGTKGFSDQTNPQDLVPLNLYGKSKNDFDIWALKQKTNPPFWYGLKFFNVYGPNEYFKGSMSSVAFKAFHQINETNELGLFKSYHPDYKDGEQLRDFVYVKDITRWMLELTIKKPTSGIYNMGFGKARSWLDLAKGLFAAMNIQLKIKWLDMPDNLKSQYQYFTEATMDKWFNQGMSRPEWSVEKATNDYVKNHLQCKDPIL